ncbi:MAG: T9SS type A sorting domain-containing protein, partial [Bacteroidota bacterium]|nr:T9SS type A sorting domain-containing protein [Bacteroidota bacterium]
QKEQVQLFQNTPNPFSGETTIGFYLPQNEDIELLLYDNFGKRIKLLASGKYEKGRYFVKINSKGLSTGSYYYTLKTTSKSFLRKMLVLE